MIGFEPTTFCMASKIAGSRSLNARMPKSPICKSSEAGSPFRSKPESSVVPPR
jgi:hypothetical protein